MALVHYLLLGMILLLALSIFLIFAISLPIPSEQVDPWSYYWYQHRPLFISIIVVNIAILILFIAIASLHWKNIGTIDPLSFSGIFLYASQIILLVAVFTSQAKNQYEPFFNVYPLVVIAAIVYLTLGILAAIIATVKDWLYLQEEKSSEDPDQRREAERIEKEQGAGDEIDT